MATSAAASSLLRLIVRENCTLLPRALPLSLPVPFTDALHARRARQKHARRRPAALQGPTCPAWWRHAAPLALVWAGRAFPTPPTQSARARSRQARAASPAARCAARALMATSSSVPLSGRLLICAAAGRQRSAGVILRSQTAHHDAHVQESVQLLVLCSLAALPLRRRQLQLFQLLFQRHVLLRQHGAVLFQLLAVLAHQRVV